ncbi:MAG TPA: hypothetical protein ENI29_17015, partial [bacterium]|nr:hypothetical protein [bacterium]
MTRHLYTILTGENCTNFLIFFSDYITFVGPPIDTSPPHNNTNFRIFIDDADPNYNWSKTV